MEVAKTNPSHVGASASSPSLDGGANGGSGESGFLGLSQEACGGVFSHCHPPPPVPVEPGEPTPTSAVCDQGSGAGSREIVGKVPSCWDLLLRIGNRM